MPFFVGALTPAPHPYVSESEEALESGYEGIKALIYTIFLGRTHVNYKLCVSLQENSYLNF